MPFSKRMIEDRLIKWLFTKERAEIRKKQEGEKPWEEWELEATLQTESEGTCSLEGVTPVARKGHQIEATAEAEKQSH